MDGHLLHFQLPHSHQSAFSVRSFFRIDWPSASEHPLFYVGIYAAIGLLNALCTLLSVAAQYTGALRASRVLFKWVGYIWSGNLSLTYILLGNFWSLSSELPSDFTIPPLKVSGILSLSLSHLLIPKLKGAWLIDLERFGLISSLWWFLMAFGFERIWQPLIHHLLALFNRLTHHLQAFLLQLSL